MTLRLRIGSLQPTMPKKDTKRLGRSRQFSIENLRSLFEELEHLSYFELSKGQKKIVGSLKESLGTPIEAWSFVPHPAVVSRLQSSSGPLTRYIFTIDTLRSRIYFRIKTFLEEQAKNVNSYYSGGWADFICDGHFTEEGLRDFMSALKGALMDAGAAPLSPQNDVSKLITLFRVEDSLVLCGRPLANFGAPSYDMLEEIVSDRLKFELVYRNYNSPEALQQFGGNEKRLKDYLKRLHSERVILCYQVVFDYAKFVDTEYVPLCQATKVMDTVLKRAQGNRDLSSPVVDLLKVRPEQVTDSAENEVTHIFINEYRFPGDRQKWKALLYQYAGEEINLYTYPLEGTLNESPVHLSDLPEVLARSGSYCSVSAKDILLGNISHPLAAENPPEAFLSLESLSNHGLTLGAPGTGKTNTDLVLVAGAAKAVRTVLIVDSTKGIASKLSSLNSEVGQPVERFSFADGASAESMEKTISDCISRRGIYLLEPDTSILPRLVDIIVSCIEGSSDETTGNRSREVAGFLLIEEANDAWGSVEGERQERIRAMEALLNKAWRKGWCIWLSTQSPSHLGFDGLSVMANLRLLRNRIIHDLGNDKGAVESLVQAFANEGMSRSDLAYVEASLNSMPPWSAILRGTSREGGKASALRPVLLKLRMLGSGSTKTAS